MLVWEWIARIIAECRYDMKRENMSDEAWGECVDEALRLVQAEDAPQAIRTVWDEE